MTANDIRALTHGWTVFGGQARKFHYVPEDNDRALCGKWALSPFVKDCREKTLFEPDNGTASPDDCVSCRRKLKGFAPSGLVTA